MNQENNNDNDNEVKNTEQMSGSSEKEAIKAIVKENQADNKNAARKQRRPQRKPQSTILDPEMEERVVSVERVAKVVKGGRRFSFSALIIIGDKKGRVGYGLGKAKEVPEAIRKATQAARKHMIVVPVDKGTIPHVITGKYCGASVLFKPAAEGTGVKSAGACRSILELSGIKNVLTKSLRGNNPHNIVKATFHALRSLRSAEQIAKARGVDIKNVRIK